MTQTDKDVHISNINSAKKKKKKRITGFYTPLGSTASK